MKFSVASSIDFWTNFCYNENKQNGKDGDITMPNKAEHRMIRVRSILMHNEKTNFRVFEATTCKGKQGSWQDTRERGTYTGYFPFLETNDRMDVTFSRIRTKFYGEQLNILDSTPEEPSTESELKRFLSSHLTDCSIATAEKIVCTYGLDAIQTILTVPTALDTIMPSLVKRQSILAELAEHESFSALLAHLGLYHVDHKYAIPIYDKYKSDSIKQIEDDPYSIYLDNIIDFWTAERIAFAKGIPYNAPRRVDSVLYQCMNDDALSNGNLFLPQAELMPRCNRMVRERKSPYSKTTLTMDEVSLALQNGVASNRYVIDNDNAACPVYLTRNYWHEEGIIKGIRSIASGIKRLSFSDQDIDLKIKNYQGGSGFKLAPEQAAAIKTALKSPLSIISGGPGTGKTQTVNALISIIKELSPSATIKMAAPTGKAAVRMEELTNGRASTVHMLLGMTSGDYILDVDVDCDFLIVDEFSMVDAALCCKLFGRVVDHTRVVLVGDYNQLPSVGPGLVLRDLISSKKLPVTMLQTIFRQAGASSIVLNSHAIINSPKSPQLSIQNKPGSDFYFLDKPDITASVHTVYQAVDSMIKRRGLSLDDIQILSPIYRTDAGVDNLNYTMQQAYNPSGDPLVLEEKEFRVGDRVIHTHNDYEKEVVNGEMGTVVKITNNAESILAVEYPRHDYPVYYSIDDLEDLELAYAITIHKSQGSEFPVVILPVVKAFERSLNLNLIYTAWTRAKQAVVMIGDRDVLYRALKKSVIDERNSLLAQKIQARL